MPGNLTFVYSRRTTLPSVLTRAVTGGAKWSHCGTVDYARGEVIEALMFKGVVATPLETWQERYPSFEFVPLQVPHPGDGILFARSQIGRPYDYWGATSVPWRGSWQDPGRWYCSELNAAIAKAAGRRLFRDDHYGISPHELFRVAF